MENTRVNAIPNKQIENEKVIITEWRFAPGAQTTWHKHNYDYAVVPALDGSLLIETPEGEDVVVELKAGESYFREKGVEHNVINNNEYDFSFVEIELKN